jgi:Domain of unknown function (DUF5666)
MSRRPTIRILLAFPLGLAWHALLAARGKPEKLDGYAEWHQGDLLIVDGQRVRTTPRTKYKLRDVAGVNLVPLGFRVEARGVRDASGVIVAASRLPLCRKAPSARASSSVTSGTRSRWETARSSSTRDSCGT